MDPNFDELSMRVNDLLQRRQEFLARPRQERFSSVSFNPYPEGSEGWKHHQQELNEINEYQHAKASLDHEFLALTEELCRIYLTTSEDKRAAIRKMVANRSEFVIHLCSYARWAAAQIVWPEDLSWLRLGLAAISIEDGHDDYRDRAVALDHLYCSAQGAGIDPKPYFQEVAALSGSVRSRQIEMWCGHVLGQDEIAEIHRSQQLRRKGK